MKSKQVWLFDLDGTLVDSRLGISNSTNATLKHFGSRELSDLELKELFGTPIRQVFSNSIQITEIEKAFNFYQDHLLENSLKDMHLFNGVVDLLTLLSDRKKIIKIVTNKHTKLAVSVLEHFNVTHFLSGTFGSDLAKPKPAPDLIELAVRGHDVGTCVMVGDQQEDIDSGVTAGVATILVGEKVHNVNQTALKADLHAINISNLIDSLED